jgi:hypothetical protein
LRKQREQKGSEGAGGVVEEVKDFKVQFYSGKEAAEEIDNEKKPFQIHHVKVTNLEKSKVTLECHDVFSSFGKMLAPGATYEFRVTDLFAKRHYWCTAQYGTSEFSFKAYGEGAPRDNNIIALHKDGAFLNGKNMKINEDDDPSKYKKPVKKTQQVQEGMFFRTGARQVNLPHEEEVEDEPEVGKNGENNES